MSKKVKLNLLAFATVFIWATAFPLTKIAGEYLSAYSLGALRCAVAAVVLIFIGKLKHIRKPHSKADAGYLFIAGLMGFALYLIFFNTGIQTLSSATSSIIIAATPIITAIGARKLYKEKIRPVGWLCIFTAFAGVVIMLLWNGVLSINIGILWTAGAAVVFCIYNLMNRRLSGKGYTALEIVTYCMISSAVILAGFLPQAVAQLADANIQIYLLVLYLGAMPSATAYLLWAKASSYAEKISEVTNYMFVTPLLSTLLGFLLLSEIPDPGTVIGGIIILVSVICFNLKK